MIEYFNIHFCATSQDQMRCLKNIQYSIHYKEFEEEAVQRFMNTLYDAFADEMAGAYDRALAEGRIHHVCYT